MTKWTRVYVTGWGVKVGLIKQAAHTQSHAGSHSIHDTLDSATFDESSQRIPMWMLRNKDFQKRFISKGASFGKPLVKWYLEDCCWVCFIEGNYLLEVIHFEVALQQK